MSDAATVPTNAAPAGQAGQPGQQQQQQQGGKFSFLRMLLIYFVFNQVMKFFMKSPRNDPNLFYNVFEEGEPFEFRLFITKSRYPPADLSNPLWYETGLTYTTNASNTRSITVQLNDTKVNDTNIYAHLFVHSLRDPNSPNFTNLVDLLNFQESFPLFEVKKRIVITDRKNLLSASGKNQTEVVEAPKNKTEYWSYLRNSVWIQLVCDSTGYNLNAVPPPMASALHLDYESKRYQPIVDVSQFWARKKHYTLLDNETISNGINLTIEFYPYHHYKYMLQVQMNQSFSMYEQYGIEASGDELKEILTDNNPYMIGITFTVSILHSIFEFLATKNDVMYWKNLNSMKGQSVNSLFRTIVIEVIIMAYLLDNETSWLILVSTGVQIVVTLWKISKAYSFKRREDGKFPWFKAEPKLSYTSTTKVYDDKATKYLYIALFPLFGLYCVYSLIYHEHKGWYSFVLETLVGFLNIFGFINMTPQLFINYKLKSVEHLPWRTLIYRFLNTIVDDFFSFVITMPWLHRLSCFRDDIIFLIYLYQRWIYRVDKNRTAEGFVDPNPEHEPLANEQKPAETKPAEKVEENKEEKATEAKEIKSKKKVESGVTQRASNEETKEATSQEGKGQESKGATLKKKKVD